MKKLQIIALDEIKWLVKQTSELVMDDRQTILYLTREDASREEKDKIRAKQPQINSQSNLRKIEELVAALKESVETEK